MNRHNLYQSEREGLTDAEADMLAEQIQKGGCTVCKRRFISTGRNVGCRIKSRFPQCREETPGFILDEGT